MSCSGQTIGLANAGDADADGMELPQAGGDGDASVVDNRCTIVDPTHGAHGYCRAILGVVFDGASCVRTDGCDCAPDCDAFFDTMELCEANCNVAAAPSCEPVPPSIDLCCSGYAVIETSGECGCVCPDAGELSFASLEACVAACGCTSQLWGPVDQQLCESTAGHWETNCGHYWCGQQPACLAVNPGCDCGPGRNFVDGVGCEDDSECPPEPSCDPVFAGECLACFGFAVTSVDGECGCICGSLDAAPLFDSLESCRAACEPMY